SLHSFPLRRPSDLALKWTSIDLLTLGSKTSEQVTGMVASCPESKVTGAEACPVWSVVKTGGFGPLLKVAWLSLGSENVTACPASGLPLESVTSAVTISGFTPSATALSLVSDKESWFF